MQKATRPNSEETAKLLLDLKKTLGAKTTTEALRRAIAMVRVDHGANEEPLIRGS